MVYLGAAPLDSRRPTCYEYFREHYAALSHRVSLWLPTLWQPLCIPLPMALDTASVPLTLQQSMKETKPPSASIRSFSSCKRQYKVGSGWGVGFYL